MSLNISNESIDENLVVILSSVGKLLVKFGDTLNFIGEILAQEDINDKQIREQIQEQLDLQLNQIEPILIEIMEKQIIFLQKLVDHKSIN